MDFSTHLLFGVTIGIIATGQLNEESFAIYATSISSSILPDLDTLSKIKGNSIYISSHRKTTHLIINIPFLALIIPLLFKLINPNNNFYSLYFLSLIASLFHVVLDIMNSYPTEIRSIKKGIKLSIIDTFDIIFSIILLLGITFSFLNKKIIYLFLVLGFLYIFTRCLVFFYLKRKLRKKYQHNFLLVPNKSSIKWRYIIEFNSYYLIGECFISFKIQRIIKKKLIPLETYRLISKNSCFQSFIKISNKFIYRSINENTFELIDLKYYQKRFFYFRALFYTKNNKIIKSYVGWNFSNHTFLKKLEGKQ